jgi:hypothetical protein
LNPWSFGQESDYFVSFARHYFFYRRYAAVTTLTNHYQRVREYLALPDRSACRTPTALRPVRRVLVAPFSTDPRRTLTRADVERLLAAIIERFSNPAVTVAALPMELDILTGLLVTHFTLGKTAAHSRRFLVALKETDLFIGVDSGPLHLADALGIQSIAIFGRTAPENVLDTDSIVRVLRLARLDGVSCEVAACRDATCIHKLCDKLDFDHPATVRFGRTISCEPNVCRATTAP